jgi:hypothetical protein
MKTRFKTEKHAREETIGRALAMAEVAVREQRDFGERERDKVDALLSTAEALELGKAIPREPAKLVAYATRVQRSGLYKGNLQ